MADATVIVPLLRSLWIAKIPVRRRCAGHFDSRAARKGATVNEPNIDAAGGVFHAIRGVDHAAWRTWLADSVEAAILEGDHASAAWASVGLAAVPYRVAVGDGERARQLVDALAADVASADGVQRAGHVGVFRHALAVAQGGDEPASELPNAPAS